MPNIIASVKANGSLWYVLDKEPELIYKKVDNIIYGTDGTFYSCYIYGKSDAAFGGRKFDIALDTGEIINCCGQWWDGGSSVVEKLLDIKLYSGGANSVERLKKCYVFCSYCIDLSKIKFLDGGKTEYEYFEYEKLLKEGDRA
jgi:hypothetical protein